MARNEDGLWALVARLVSGWPAARRKRFRGRWARIDFAGIAAPVLPSHRRKDGRGSVPCTVCGVPTVRKFGDKRGRTPATCGDPVCRTIRYEVRRSMSELGRLDFALGLSTVLAEVYDDEGLDEESEERDLAEDGA